MIQTSAIERQRAIYLRDHAYPCERCSVGWHEMHWWTSPNFRRLEPAYFDKCAICGLNGSPKAGIGEMTFKVTR